MRTVILEKIDVRDTPFADPSRSKLILFLKNDKTTPSAESVYQWLAEKSLIELQNAPGSGGVAITTSNLREMLSSLERIGKGVGFSIDMSVKSKEAVFVIGNIPKDAGASILIEELLTIIFARLAKIESRISHTETTTTAGISLW